MNRDGNEISEQAYMYEAILAKHELNEAMVADGAGPHARHSGLWLAATFAVLLCTLKALTGKRHSLY